ncbi:MAG: hypothetical protein NT169_07420 [Chloroflexi bacterium]|nr:hypothetical protein [Chloroflexota bacterium]
MNSKERLMLALNKEKPDHLPATVHQWQGYHLDTYLGGMSDLEAFKAVGQYGHKMGFCGNMNVMTWALGTQDEIKTEVLTKLNAAKGGGFIFQSDHSVPSNVSGENYEYVVNLMREYGKYCRGQRHGGQHFRPNCASKQPAAPIRLVCPQAETPKSWPKPVVLREKQTCFSFVHTSCFTRTDMSPACR